MPGERSLYRKIQVTIEYAEEGQPKNVETLVEYMYRRSPTNFAYYWRDKNDAIKHDYSKNSINDIITLCIELGLITKNGQLTNIGISATDPRRFPIILGKRTARLLGEKGISIEKIVTAINRTLSSAVPRPSTVDEIWSHVGETDKIDFLTFKRLMNLLGECRVLFMTQKRIYLPFS